MPEPGRGSREFVNVERPEQIPSRPDAKAYSVIARLVLPDLSEEWRPATAVRWNDTHVLVGVDLDDDREYLWLRVDDVKRVIRRPPPPSSDVSSDTDQPASSDTA